MDDLFCSSDCDHFCLCGLLPTHMVSGDTLSAHIRPPYSSKMGPIFNPLTELLVSI